MALVTPLSFNLDGWFIVYWASSERQCPHVGAHGGFGGNDSAHREDVTYVTAALRFIEQHLRLFHVLCFPPPHSPADLDGSWPCGHADQPRAGLLHAGAGGRLSRMQSRSLWSPRDGPELCCAGNSPKLIMSFLHSQFQKYVPESLKGVWNVLFELCDSSGCFSCFYALVSRLCFPALSLFCRNLYWSVCSTE